MRSSTWFSQRFNPSSINRFVSLLFLIVIFFAPYQTKWSSLVPQTGLMLLGIGLMGLDLFQKGCKQIRLDWPILLLIICLVASTFYHQSFNIYARAYALSIASYIWLRHTLHPDDILLIVTIAKYVLLAHFFLLLAQFFWGKAWFVASYLTHVGDYRIPLGLYDIPTTAGLIPAALLLFLLAMQVRKFITGSFILNICYLITPFAILVTSSRSTLISFFGALLVVILINVKYWRRLWPPLILLLFGFVFFSLLIHKNQNYSQASAVFDVKVTQAVKTTIKRISDLTQNDQVAPKVVMPDQTIFIDSSVESRLQLWKFIIKEIADKPDILIKGIGLGQSQANFKSLLDSGVLSQKVFGNNIISPHNSIVELFYEGGVFVGLALIIFLGSRLFNGINIQAPWFGALLFLILFMMFYDLLRMRYLWIILALVEVYSFPPKPELLGSSRNFLNPFNPDKDLK